MGNKRQLVSLIMVLIIGLGVGYALGGTTVPARMETIIVSESSPTANLIENVSEEPTQMVFVDRDDFGFSTLYTEEEIATLTSSQKQGDCDVLVNNQVKCDRILHLEGISMYPNMLNGSVICCNEIPFSDVKLEDNLAFEMVDNSWVHRAVKENDKGFIMQGDNNLGIDPVYVTDDNLLCRVDTVWNDDFAGCEFRRYWT